MSRAAEAREGCVGAVKAAMIFFTRPASMKSPSPLRPSLEGAAPPAPFETVVSPFAPWWYSAVSRLIGLPAPNPGINSVMSSGMSATASAIEAWITGRVILVHLPVLQPPGRRM